MQRIDGVQNKKKETVALHDRTFEGGIDKNFLYLV